jgi:heme-degrading monooxygenase HmoA
MVARVTLAEIDTVRTRIDSAVSLYKQSVIPELRHQAGYEGCYVLTTPEGKVAVITFWNGEEAADAGVQSGYYAEQVKKFLTFYRAAPGRDTYDVSLAEAPAITIG